MDKMYLKQSHACLDKWKKTFWRKKKIPFLLFFDF